MHIQRTSRFRRRLTLYCMLVLVGGSGAICWGGFARFGSDQRSLREHCNKLFLEARREQRRRLENPHLEQDEKDAYERNRWTQIILETTQSLAPITATSRKRTPRAASECADDEANTHWSFRRLRPVTPPAVSDNGWLRNTIDRFILAELEKAGLEPAPDAGPQVLARRLWFDLIGLPPDPEEVTSYLADADPHKYEDAVADLLNRGAFGERWARVWLDVARYADSNGYEEDEIRPHAYPYRDFVIWAMNHDLPYDEFIRWQIAGDESGERNPLAVAATGFFTAGPYNTFLPQPSERRDELDDMVSTMGSGMLGLTIGCARCHDHMYDPISSEEYYRLVAIFSETRRHLRYLVPNGGQEYLPIDQNLAELRELQRARVVDEKISRLDFNAAEKELLRQPIDPENEEQALLLSLCGRCRLVMDHEISNDLAPLQEDEARYERLRVENARLASTLPPPPPKGLTLAGNTIAKTQVLAGGQPGRKTRLVGPGFLDALTRGKPNWDEDAWIQWSGDTAAPKPRTALANWITDLESGAGPLLARVIVNRLWQHHFGTGLVATPSDFGREGAPPTHPELLDWLANELVNHGWSLKHIHRLIVTSATYRQAAMSNSDPNRIETEQRLVAGRRPQRLTAEMIRDALLVAGGNLNDAMYGPAVFVAIPPEAIFNKEDQENLVWPTHVPERDAVWRRGIYVLMKRTNPVPMLRLFDGPDASLPCSERKVTTVPTQSLALMNAPFVRKQAERMTQRLMGANEDSAQDVQQLVGAIFMHSLGRQPSEQESELAIEFLTRAENEETRRAALIDLCHLMFMSNEFVYLD